MNKLQLRKYLPFGNKLLLARLVHIKNVTASCFLGALTSNLVRCEPIATLCLVGKKRKRTAKSTFLLR